MFEEWLSFDEACEIVFAKLGATNARSLLWGAILRRELTAGIPMEEAGPDRLFPDAAYTPSRMPTRDRQNLTIVLRDSLMKWLHAFVSQPPDASVSMRPAVKNKGGGKEKWDWEELEREFVKRVRRDGWPDRTNVEGWSTQADVARWLIDLAEREKKGEPSWPSAIRRARQMLEKYHDMS